MTTADESPPDHNGHRARLRARLLCAGGDSFADHELLEYLLGLAIPRRDTKPLAKLMLREFGGIQGVFAADPDALMRMSGVGETAAAAIRIVQATALRLSRTEIEDRPILANWQALIDYLRVDMAGLGIERVRLILLNTRNALIRDVVLSEGTIDAATVHVREVIRIAIDAQAAAIIIVHNHPSGDPQPSRADITLTRDIIAAAKPLGIAVHDHVIIGRTGHVSLRAQGLI